MKKFIIAFLFISTTLFSQSNEIDTLLLKINQTKNPMEKKELLEELKVKLAKRNIKAQEESNAIIKAKSKLPSKAFKLEP
ncbi:hypothetical protein ACH5BF_11615 [Arcobacter sp. YIC-464]|uniref:hypothetical protein n=1 Tax=Arcobacter sp. YIC-464 TaxID=3376631 RepID=UPI003C1C8266